MEGKEVSGWEFRRRTRIFETILKRKLIVLPNPRRTQLIHSTASTKASYFVLLYRPECSGLPVRKTQLINPTPPLTPITEAQHHDDLPPTNRHPLTHPPPFRRPPTSRNTAHVVPPRCVALDDGMWICPANECLLGQCPGEHGIDAGAVCCERA
eukprot:scaffold2361_cov203-Alexandrium_tamarense.AAC.19